MDTLASMAQRFAAAETSVHPLRVADMSPGGIAVLPLLAGGFATGGERLKWERRESMRTERDQREFASATAERDTGIEGEWSGIIPDELDLTPRELAVLHQLRNGNSNKRIATALKMQESTVKVHVLNIFKKLHVANRTHAALVANRLLSSMPRGPGQIEQRIADLGQDTGSSSLTVKNKDESLGAAGSVKTMGEKDEASLAAEMDAILERLDQGIAAEHLAMDRLLERMVSGTSR